MTVLLSILASTVRLKLEEMKPMSSCYADVNGIRLYHEIYGQGEPLVLIHGGLTTIGEMQGWVQPLAKTRRGIAGGVHGPARTGDTDTPISFPPTGAPIAPPADPPTVARTAPHCHSIR